MRRVSLFLLLALFTSCVDDVVLGWYALSAGDGGSADAGLPDSGSADAGGFTPDAADVDAGPLDSGAGAGDAGPGDSGAPDAGSTDAGSIDSGSGDAGSADGGAVDAGAVDAGPSGANLGVQVSAVTTVELSDQATVQVTVTNRGSSTALDAGIVVRLPPGISLLAASPCTILSGDTFWCPILDLSAGATASATYSILAGGEYQWGDMPVRAVSETNELDAGDNLFNSSVAATPAGTVPLLLNTPVTLDVSACRGTNISSWVQCVPGSIQVEQYTFFPDGGVTDGLGFDGLWSQSAHNRNLSFRFFDTASGHVEAGFVGGSVSATCFQGTIDYGGVPYVGAWRACVP